MSTSSKARSGGTSSGTSLPAAASYWYGAPSLYPVYPPSPQQAVAYPGFAQRQYYNAYPGHGNYVGWDYNSGSDVPPSPGFPPPKHGYPPMGPPGGPPGTPSGPPGPYGYPPYWYHNSNTPIRPPGPDEIRCGNDASPYRLGGPYHYLRDCSQSPYGYSEPGSGVNHFHHPPHHGQSSFDVGWPGSSGPGYIKFNCQQRNNYIKQSALLEMPPTKPQWNPNRPPGSAGSGPDRGDFRGGMFRDGPMDMEQGRYGPRGPNRRNMNSWRDDPRAQGPKIGRGGPGMGRGEPGLGRDGPGMKRGAPEIGGRGDGPPVGPEESLFGIAPRKVSSKYSLAKGGSRRNQSKQQQSQKDMVSTMKEDWPDTLIRYVERCFATCDSDTDKDNLEIVLKGKLIAAYEMGSLWTHNWDAEAVPSVPIDSMFDTPGGPLGTQSRPPGPYSFFNSNTPRGPPGLDNLRDGNAAEAYGPGGPYHYPRDGSQSPYGNSKPGGSGDDGIGSHHQPHHGQTSFEPHHVGGGWPGSSGPGYIKFNCQQKNNNKQNALLETPPTKPQWNPSRPGSAGSGPDRGDFRGGMFRDGPMGMDGPRGPNRRNMNWRDNPRAEGPEIDRGGPGMGRDGPGVDMEGSGMGRYAPGIGGRGEGPPVRPEESLFGSIPDKVPSKDSLAKGSSQSNLSKQQQSRKDIISMVKIDWPDTLTHYVERCFATCVSDLDKDHSEIVLTCKLTAAAKTGSLWTHNWDAEAVPSVPSDSIFKTPGGPPGMPSGPPGPKGDPSYWYPNSNTPRRPPGPDDLRDGNEADPYGPGGPHHHPRDGSQSPYANSRPGGSGDGGINSRHPPHHGQSSFQPHHVDGGCRPGSSGPGFNKFNFQQKNNYNKQNALLETTPTKPQWNPNRPSGSAGSCPDRWDIRGGMFRDGATDMEQGRDRPRGSNRRNMNSWRDDPHAEGPEIGRGELGMGRNGPVVGMRGPGIGRGAPEIGGRGDGPPVRHEESLFGSAPGKVPSKDSLAKGGSKSNLSKQQQQQSKKDMVSMMKGEWPGKLKRYVERCFATFVTDLDKDQMEIVLKGKLMAAAETGSLWTHDWDTEALPSVHSDSMFKSIRNRFPTRGSDETKEKESPEKRPNDFGRGGGNMSRGGGGGRSNDSSRGSEGRDDDKRSGRRMYIHIFIQVQISEVFALRDG